MVLTHEDVASLSQAQTIEALSKVGEYLEESKKAESAAVKAVKDVDALEEEIEGKMHGAGHWAACLVIGIACGLLAWIGLGSGFWVVFVFAWLVAEIVDQAHFKPRVREKALAEYEAALPGLLDAQAKTMAALEALDNSDEAFNAVVLVPDNWLVLEAEIDGSVKRMPLERADMVELLLGQMKSGSQSLDVAYELIKVKGAAAMREVAYEERISRLEKQADWVQLLSGTK